MENTDNITRKDYDEPHDLVYDAKIKDIYKANHKKEWREEAQYTSLTNLEKLKKLGIDAVYDTTIGTEHDSYRVNMGDMTLYQVIMFINYGHNIYFMERKKK